MRNKFLSALVLGALMAACETAPTDNQVNVASEPTPGSVEDFNKNIKNRVYFGFDKSALTADAAATVAAQAGWLKAYPNMKATLEGNADIRGTREYNLALGEKRANAVKKALVKHGVEAGRLDAISNGKEKPINLGTDEAAHAENRNVTTVVKG